MLASALTNSTTTIEIQRDVLTELKKRRDPVMDRNWSDVLRRELARDGDVYVKIITVDGFIADSADHEIIFQLGDNPPHYYRYLNGKFEPLEALPKIKAEAVE